MKHIVVLSFCLFAFSLSAQTISWSDDFSKPSNKWAQIMPDAPEHKLKDGAMIISKDVFTLYYLPIDFEKDYHFEIELLEFKKLNFIVGSDRWAQQDLDLSLDLHAKDKELQVEIDKEDHHRVEEMIYKELVPLAFDWSKPCKVILEKVGTTKTFYIQQGAKKKELYSGELSIPNGKSWFGFYGGKESNKVIVDKISLNYEEYVPPGEIAFEKGTINKTKLGSEINNGNDQVAPIVSPNGKKFWFSSHNDQFDMIFSADIDGAGFGKVKEASKPINQSGHNNTIINVSPDGNTVYISGYYDKGKYVKSGLSRIDKKKKGWGKPQGLDITGFTNKGFFTSYYITSDGNIIVLQMQKGRDHLQGADLFVSFRQKDGSYTKPKDLGPTVNSPRPEGTPFLAPDLKTLYFTSEGHPGFGSADLFMSRRLDNTWTNWTTPQNLGPDINTGDWEGYFSIPASGSHGYLVSYYTGENRSADIFKVTLPESARPEAVILVKGKVLDEATNLPIGAKITYHDLETDTEMGTALSDPETGYFEIILPEKKEYSFYAEAEDYYSVRENINLTANEEYNETERDLRLAPIAKGEAIRLNNVFFVQSKATLMPKSLPELNKLVELLNDNPDLKIQVEGHTDNRGSADLNKKLSEERAQKVVDYLVEKGIPKKRLKAEGFGGTKPAGDNRDETTRKLNRRVEFRIL